MVQQLIDLLEILLFTQGIVFGLIFIFTNRQEKSTLFLGLFLITYVFSEFPTVLNFLFQTPALNYEFHGVFLFLTIALFYMYAKQVSVLKDKCRSYLLLIPGIIEVIVFALLALFKISYEDTLPFDIYALIGIVFSLWMTVKIFRFAKKHLELVKDQYASISKLRLFWVKQYSIVLLFNFIIIIIASIFVEEEEGSYEELILLVFNLFLVYWIIYNGFQQENVTLLVQDEQQNNLDTAQATKENKEEDIMEMKAITLALDTFFEKTKVFKKRDLTVVDVSVAVGISPKKISKAINQIKKVNFNTYINTLRLEEAVLYLNDPKHYNLSIEGIGQEAGFNSKSVFYCAFKKKYNCTPLQFRK